MSKQYNQIIFLGTGTSTGTPIVGCPCSVCSSSDTKDKRLRCSIYVQTSQNFSFIVDTGPDLRTGQHPAPMDGGFSDRAGKGLWRTGRRHRQQQALRPWRGRRHRRKFRCTTDRDFAQAGPFGNGLLVLSPHESLGLWTEHPSVRMENYTCDDLKRASLPGILSD